MKREIEVSTESPSSGMIKTVVAMEISGARDGNPDEIVPEESGSDKGSPTHHGGRLKR